MKKKKNIIIHPTDFSNCAMSALAYTEKLCLALDAELLLIHAIDLNKLAGFDDSGRSLLNRSKEIEDEARSEVNKLGERLAKNGVECKARLYKGSILQCLPKIVEETNAKIIVMGTTGAGSFSNSIFGSTTYAVVQSSKVPVIAIPESGEFSLSDEILLASDLNRADFNFSILNFLSDFARKIDAKIDLLYAPDQGHSKEQTEKIVAKLNEAGHEDLEISMAPGKDYIKAIEAHLKDHETGLFAMIISNKNILEKFVFGSLSKKLIHQAKIPLLMIPRNLVY